MTKRMKLLAAVGGLSAASLLGMAQTARADFNLYLKEDAGPVTLEATGSDFSPVQFSGTFGDFNVTFFGATSQNGASLSDLLSSTTTIAENVAGVHTLTMYVSEQDYTVPAGTVLNMESGMSGTLNSGLLVNAATFQALEDNGNSLTPTSGIFTYNNGLQTSITTGSTFDTGSATGAFVRGAGDYSLTSEATFVMSANATANISDHVNVTAAPLPATASMGLGLFGIVGAVGGLNALRRRRAAAAL